MPNDFPTIKAAIDQTATAFETFKQRNDERVAELKRQQEQDRERLEMLEAKDRQPGRTADHLTKADSEHRRRFDAWLRDPRDERKKSALAQIESEIERKEVTIGSASGGGYALPVEIDRQIEWRVRQLNPLRGLVRTVAVGTSDYRQLVSMSDSTSGWVGEGDARSATTTPTLRERKPSFGTAYALPIASEESVADIAFDVGQWLVEDASDEFASAEATAIISGNGDDKPTGFLNSTPTNETDASVAREAGELQYIAGGDASVILADGLFSLQYSIREKYLADAENVAWVMSRSTLAAISKLKTDGATGDYLLQPALAERVRPQLLGYPVFTVDAMPSVAGNAHPIAFGNWRRGYLLADRGGLRITVDDNISTPGKVRFYVRRRVGGCILNNDAIKVLKISTT